MEDKRDLLKRLTPKAALDALTPEAAHAVPGGMIVDNLIPILRFPFRVGRESRVQLVDGKLHRVERSRQGAAEPNNDLYLVDGGQPLQISREHFRIERTAQGFELVDRGSACGTGVGAGRAGGEDKGGKLALRDGDTIIVGTGPTPYRYRFIVFE